MDISLSRNFDLHKIISCAFINKKYNEEQEMRAISLLFQAASIGLTLGILSGIGHKAASDYCIITPEPDPFDPVNIAGNKTTKHRNFCYTAKILEKYNPLYFPISENTQEL